MGTSSTSSPTPNGPRTGAATTTSPNQRSPRWPSNHTSYRHGSSSEPEPEVPLPRSAGTCGCAAPPPGCASWTRNGQRFSRHIRDSRRTPPRRVSKASAGRGWSRPSSRASSTGCWERSEEHTSELQSLRHLVCRLLLEKKKKKKIQISSIEKKKKKKLDMSKI